MRQSCGLAALICLPGIRTAWWKLKHTHTHSPVSLNLLCVEGKDLEAKSRVCECSYFNNFKWIFHIIPFTFLIKQVILKKKLEYLSDLSSWECVSYLSGPLQVPKVNVRDEEHRLSLQVSHGLKEGGVRLLGNGYHAHAAIFPWRDKHPELHCLACFTFWREK